MQDYTITSADGNKMAEISKQIFKLTDTYVIDVAEPKDALGVLMFVLALDAEKCSRNQRQRVFKNPLTLINYN